MALINRFARLFRADINAVLDRIEEPSIVLAQALREMENNLQRDQKKLTVLDSEIKMLTTKLSFQENNNKVFQSEINLCLDANNEKLAKSLIRKKLQANKHIEQLNQKTNEISIAYKSLEKYIVEKQQTLTEVQQKVELVSTDESCSEPGIDTLLSNLPKVVSDDEIEVEYLKLSHQNLADSKKRKAS